MDKEYQETMTAVKRGEIKLTTHEEFKAKMEKNLRMTVTYKVKYTPRAEADIERILDYFIIENDYLNYAVKLQLAIMGAVDKMAKMPSAGQLETRFRSKTNKVYRKVRALKQYVVSETREATGDVIIIPVYYIGSGLDMYKKDLP